jgi:polyhydroxyalkanoate synthesis regulator phasin
MKLAKWAFGGIALFTAAGAIAFGAVTLRSDASAQTPGPGGGTADVSRHDEILAQKLGVSVDELRTAREETRDQLIDEAVAAGKITAEQGARLKEAKLGEFLMKIGALHEKLGNANGSLRIGVAGVVTSLDAAADLMKISREQLATELRSGKSLAQVASDHGVTRDQLKAALLGEAKTKLDEAVRNGRMTQAQADEAYAALQNRIDAMVDRVGGEKPEGFRMRVAR